MNNKLKTVLIEKSELEQELENIKNKYTKKEKKITDLQGAFTKSITSYNSGVNNLKIAKKLDNEIKKMIDELKERDLDNKIY